jgi:hypothetical protein
VAICAVGVHRRQADAGLAAEEVLRQEQDLRSVQGPDGVGRSAAAAVVVGEVGELLAIGVDRENLATGP